MIPMRSGVRVWLATGHTDMRKGMQGLPDVAAPHLVGVDLALSVVWCDVALA